MSYVETFKVVPEKVKTAFGSMQSTFSQWEGETRKVISSQFEKVKESPSVKKMEETVDDWRSRYISPKGFEPILQRVDSLRNDWGKRALDTLGAASKEEVQSLSNKINKLRTEVRKLSDGAKESSSN